MLPKKLLPWVAKLDVWVRIPFILSISWRKATLSLMDDLTYLVNPWRWRGTAFYLLWKFSFILIIVEDDWKLALPFIGITSAALIIDTGEAAEDCKNWWLGFGAWSVSKPFSDVTPTAQDMLASESRRQSSQQSKLYSCCKLLYFGTTCS